MLDLQFSHRLLARSLSIESPGPLILSAHRDHRWLCSSTSRVTARQLSEENWP